MMQHAGTHLQSRHGTPPPRRPDKALRSTRKPELAKILARHNGLTSVEIRGLATKWKCCPEAITKLVVEWGYPILAQRQKPDAAAPDHPTPPPPGQVSEAFAIIGDDDAEDVAALRKELDRVRHQLDEAQRIRRVAESEIARARAEIERTAALRRETVRDREIIRDQAQRIEALEAQLADAVAVVAQPFAARLRSIRSDDLSAMFEDWLRELNRRREGGRQTRLGRVTTYG